MDKASNMISRIDHISACLSVHLSEFSKILNFQFYQIAYAIQNANIY